MHRDDVRQIMDYLVSYRATQLPPGALAEVFDRLIWCLDDDGAVLAVREEWLKGSDRYRVEVALTMDETFPFVDREMMVRVFAAIGARWPDLIGTCDRIRIARDALYSRSGRC